MKRSRLCRAVSLTAATAVFGVAQLSAQPPQVTPHPGDVVLRINANIDKLPSGGYGEIQSTCMVGDQSITHEVVDPVFGHIASLIVTTTRDGQSLTVHFLLEATQQTLPQFATYGIMVRPAIDVWVAGPIPDLPLQPVAHWHGRETVTAEVGGSSTAAPVGYGCVLGLPTGQPAVPSAPASICAYPNYSTNHNFVVTWTDPFENALFDLSPLGLQGTYYHVTGPAPLPYLMLSGASVFAGPTPPAWAELSIRYDIDFLQTDPDCSFDPIVVRAPVSQAGISMTQVIGLIEPATSLLEGSMGARFYFAQEWGRLDKNYDVQWVQVMTEYQLNGVPQLEHFSIGSLPGIDPTISSAVNCGGAPGFLVPDATPLYWSETVWNHGVPSWPFPPPHLEGKWSYFLDAPSWSGACGEQARYTFKTFLVAVPPGAAQGNPIGVLAGFEWTWISDTLTLPVDGFASYSCQPVPPDAGLINAAVANDASWQGLWVFKNGLVLGELPASATPSIGSGGVTAGTPSAYGGALPPPSHQPVPVEVGHP
ncbi:MAG: hypothetical protein ACT4PU_00570 [Planctomycetota bacterium]